MKPWKFTVDITIKDVSLNYIYQIIESALQIWSIKDEYTSLNIGF